EAELRAEAAASARPLRPPRQRARDWRDTGLARLLHRLRPDEEESLALAWLAALALGLLLCWWWLA
ncbi:MAG TPA: hypothetical protein VJN44_03155, partial [Roseateles sp.]|nr:hypothetical protein [Roseateles sp.]